MLETDRMRLLGWESEDWLAVRPIATNPEVLRFIRNGQPWPDEQIREFVERQRRHLAARGFCMWKLVGKNLEGLMGFCGLQPIEIEGVPEVEIGWWLAPEHWGKGLATEAARAALADGFSRHALARIIAVAQSANRASRRVMEKLGMHYERDTTHRGFPVVLYSIARPASPAE